MKPYETRDVHNEDLAAVGVTTGVAIAVPAAQLYQITFKSLVVTATDAPVAPASGDDGTITVSCDGVNYFAPSTDGAAVVLQCDAPTLVSLPASLHITHVKIATAQILGTETVTYTINSVNNS